MVVASGAKFLFLVRSLISQAVILFLGHFVDVDIMGMYPIS